MRVKEFCADELFYVRELSYSKEHDSFFVRYYAFEGAGDAECFMIEQKNRYENNIYTRVDKDEKALAFVDLKNRKFGLYSD